MIELESTLLQDENNICRDVVGVLRYEISIFRMLGLSNAALSEYIMQHGIELRREYCETCVYRPTCKVKP